MCRTPKEGDQKESEREGIDRERERAKSVWDSKPNAVIVIRFMLRVNGPEDSVTVA